MDVFLLIVGFLFMLIGIIGCFIPILPGPIMSWLGLLLLYLTKTVEDDWWFIGITLVIALIVFTLDYLIPVIGTKKFGGSKAGITGTTIGLLVAVFFPILGFFGIIIWPFVGAFTGELINKADTNTAIKAAFGSFLGFLTGTFLKFIIACFYLYFFINTSWEYRAELNPF